MNASQSVQLIGESNGPSGLFVNSEVEVGNAGELTINTPWLLVQDGALVFAGTSGSGNGGNVTVNVSSLLVRDGSAIGSSTLGSGRGGNVTVNASQDVQLIGESADGQSSSEFRASTRGTGDGGTVTINTPLLLVRDKAAVTARSAGEGRAGNLQIQADSIRLDNQASLNANTTSSRTEEQANIILNSTDVVLRHQSKITTNAQGLNVIGGNITIDTGVLAALENSDITANSTDFRGGNVRINAQGIFSTKFREAPTPESDITATGKDSSFSGTVTLNTPDVDLNSGLINLPTAPVDTQVSQVCQAGVRQNQNSFIISGRGGLPPNPRQVLRSQSVQVDWVTLDAGANNPTEDVQSWGTQRRVSGEHSSRISNNVNTQTTEIVEAQGWVVDANGNIVLVATAPTVTPHSSWLPPTDCRTDESTN